MFASSQSPAHKGPHSPRPSSIQPRLTLVNGWTYCRDTIHGFKAIMESSNALVHTAMCPRLIADPTLQDTCLPANAGHCCRPAQQQWVQILQKTHIQHAPCVRLTGDMVVNTCRLLLAATTRPSKVGRLCHGAQGAIQRPSRPAKKHTALQNQHDSLSGTSETTSSSTPAAASHCKHRQDIGAHIIPRCTAVRLCTKAPSDST